MRLTIATPRRQGWWVEGLTLANQEHGGGASRSTDPAEGTSTATDVSLREYVAQSLASAERFLAAEIASLRRETEAANRNAERAIEVAAHEASERLAAHNGLIDQMQAQQSTFATRESLDDFKETYRKRHEELKDNIRQSADDYRTANDQRIGRIERFQAMLIGGLILVSFIGIANLIKVWTG